MRQTEKPPQDATLSVAPKRIAAMAGASCVSVHAFRGRRVSPDKAARSGAPFTAACMVSISVSYWLGW